MRRILKSVTLWFFLASILVIVLNATGNDYKNILLIGLNSRQPFSL